MSFEPAQHLSEEEVDIKVYITNAVPRADATNFGNGYGFIRVNPAHIHNIAYMIHEFGHMVGLDNSSCDPAAMHGTHPNPGLTCSDVTALNNRYPHSDPQSPILIDLNGDGIHLSSATDGTIFDITASGVPMRVAWTLDDSDAFLALDRDGDGHITSGAELFGNNTLLASGQRATDGYEVLAELDINVDGVIDAFDPKYEALRLWVDRNRNGVSEPDEMSTLRSYGVVSISVHPKESERRDRWRNEYRLRSEVTCDVAPRRRYSYDVFLTVQDRN